MATEWPKTIYQENNIWTSDVRASHRTDVKEQVIPADLGEELAEAVRQFVSDYGLEGMSHPGADALARYEREVGDG